jgi:chromate transporter
MTRKILPKLRSLPVTAAFLDGVNAAAVALMAFVGWEFAKASLISWPAIVIAAVSLILLVRYRVNTAWLVLGGALAGIAVRAAGWG